MVRPLLIWQSRTMEGEAPDGRDQRRGFALITVLFGISILTVLISASMSRTLAHVKIAKHAVSVHHEELEREALLPLVALRIEADQVPGQAFVPRTYSIDLEGKSYKLSVTDTAGLIDVNTVDWTLLKSLLKPHLEQTEYERIVAELKTRRQLRRRFPSVDDFIRSTALPRTTADTLRLVLTVQSGLRWPTYDAMLENVRELVRIPQGEWTVPTNSIIYIVDVQVAI